eukprot:IDg5284t1
MKPKSILITETPPLMPRLILKTLDLNLSGQDRFNSQRLMEKTIDEERESAMYGCDLGRRSATHRRNVNASIWQIVQFIQLCRCISLPPISTDLASLSVEIDHIPMDA